MYEVCLYQAPYSPHLTQVLAGLVSLEARGELRIDVQPLPSALDDGESGNLLWMLLKHGAETRTICFDMLDGDTLCEPLVRKADVYFKRAFCVEGHTRLDWQRELIRPYGLNFHCVADDIDRYDQLERMLFRRERNVSGSLDQWRKRLLPWLGREAARESDFQCSAGSEAVEGVVFLTRLWGRRSVPKYSEEALHELNNSRVEVVSALKRAFGERFHGGLQDTPTAREVAPQLIYSGRTDRSSYLTLMQRYLIGVTTTGLHRSVGWKFAEYIAASRCIVSETLCHSQPNPPIEGEHFLGFDGAEECVAACDRLLSNSGEASQMRFANQMYFEKHLRSGELLRHCLAVAAGRCS